MTNDHRGMPAVTLPDGTSMPALGAGTWRMGEDPARLEREQAALAESIACGVRLIDTAEMYADGGAERVVGGMLADCGVPRGDLFLVGKVLPGNAGKDAMRRSLEASLTRLGVDYLDLYLLHWRGTVPLAETVAAFRGLRDEGLIRRWGVSNLDVPDMEELMEVPGGGECATDQVLYHLGSRGIEVALQPWLDARGIPVMAYSPLAQGGTLTGGLFDDPAVRAVAARHGATPAQALLAWVMRDGATVAIPMASSPEHARLNAEAARLTLDAEDLDRLDRAFPRPAGHPPLDWL